MNSKAIVSIAIALASISAFADEMNKLPMNQEDKVIIADAELYPPYTTDEKSGLSVDIIRHALSSQGYSLSLRITPWIRALEETKSGKAEALVDTWYDKERTAYFLYSDPYIENVIEFVKLKDNPFEYSGLDSLKGYSVGLIKEYVYGEEFINSKSFTKEFVNTELLNYKKLLSGRIDLTVGDKFVVLNQMKQYGLPFEKIAFTQTPLTVKTVHLVCAKKNPQCKNTIEVFNKGLKEIRSNGTYDKLLKQHGYSR